MYEHNLCCAKRFFLKTLFYYYAKYDANNDIVVLIFREAFFMCIY